MKRDNCVEVKNVNKLSIPYLTRFFGSVGPIVKVEKDDISKVVTIVSPSTFRNSPTRLVWIVYSALKAGYSTRAPSKLKNLNSYCLSKLYRL